MASEPSFPDLKQLEARLLAERQAYYDRTAAQRSSMDDLLGEMAEDQTLDAYLKERLERLLGIPPDR